MANQNIGNSSTTKRVASKTTTSNAKKSTRANASKKNNSNINEELSDENGKVYIKTRKAPWSTTYTAMVAIAIVLSALAVLMVLNNFVFSAVRVLLNK